MPVKILPIEELLKTSSMEDIKASLGDICIEAAAHPVEVDRQAFLNRWLFQYIDQFPSYTFVATEDSNFLGYITACPNTSEYFDKLDQKGLDLWSSYYTLYPAHLHINCSSAARGKGVGSRLLAALEIKLRQDHVPGLHLITAKGARNVGFYEKNQYETLCENKLGETSLLFMGKRLAL